jgi:hypothetical protein
MSALVITQSGETTTLDRNTRGYFFGAIFFLVLGTLDVVAGVATASADALGPGLGCLLAGAVFGLIPHRIVVEIVRAAGEVRRRSKSLFNGSETTDALADFTSVEIEVQTYSDWFHARRKNGGALALFPEMKTWTFTRVAPPDTVARAQQIADALRIPLAPPPR